MRLYYILADLSISSSYLLCIQFDQTQHIIQIDTKWYKLIGMLLTKLICEKSIFVVDNTSKYCFCHLLCKFNSKQTCEKALHPDIFDAKIY